MAEPAPLSYGRAIDSVGTVGSSLLAGFSLASVTVVTARYRQDQTRTRPGT